MKKIYFKTGIVGIICLLSFTTVPVSCSSDDDGSHDTEITDDGRKLCQLTIDEVPITRATLIDNTNVVGAKWTEGDKATIFNLKSFTSSNMDVGSLTAASSAATSSFSGKVKCTINDDLALIYPATYPIITGVDRGKFSISLDGQNGTLSDIATHFHYICGVGTVTEVTGNIAHATVSSMKSLLAVCKFKFIDKTTLKDIPVKTLRISYEDASTGYPLTGKVATNDFVAVAANQEEWTDPLTVTLTTETSYSVYVALFPVKNSTFHFTVTNSSGTYTGTATATLNAGKYYPVELKLTKN